MEKWENRLTESPCSEIFLTRRSTRAFDPLKKISKEDLLSCFEAAKWAPSCSNNQPWRYVCAEIGSTSYLKMIESMVEFNQNWAKNAQFLILICSKMTNKKDNSYARTHSFDTGASYIQFILEAHLRKIACHPMDGFSHEKIRLFFKIPETYQIQALLACGMEGNINLLSEELKKRETPSLRKRIEEFVSFENFEFD